MDGAVHFTKQSRNGELIQLVSDGLTDEDKGSQHFRGRVRRKLSIPKGSVYKSNDGKKSHTTISALYNPNQGTRTLIKAESISSKSGAHKPFRVTPAQQHTHKKTYTHTHNHHSNPTSTGLLLHRVCFVVVVVIIAPRRSQTTQRVVAFANKTLHSPLSFVRPTFPSQFPNGAHACASAHRSSDDYSDARPASQSLGGLVVHCAIQLLVASVAQQL